MGNALAVKILREGKPTLTEEVDMSNSCYDVADDKYTLRLVFTTKTIQMMVIIVFKRPCIACFVIPYP